MLDLPYEYCPTGVLRVYHTHDSTGVQLAKIETVEDSCLQLGRTLPLRVPGTSGIPSHLGSGFVNRVENIYFI